MTITRRCAVAATLLFACGHPLAAQGTGSIQGIVRSETGVLEGATVNVIGTTATALTRSDGRYTINAVAPGSHIVRASRLARTFASSGMRS